MGYGFLESVYEKCLLIELKKAGLHALAQNIDKQDNIYLVHPVILSNIFFNLSPNL
jgi:hypothetical protein